MISALSDIFLNAIKGKVESCVPSRMIGPTYLTMVSMLVWSSVAYDPILAAIPLAIPPRNQSFVQLGHRRPQGIERELLQIRISKSAEICVNILLSTLKLQASRSHHKACTP